MLSDIHGNVLIIEPGIGYVQERERYSLITNYSVLRPETTRPFINPGDDRYERARALLDGFDEDFSVEDAFSVLRAVLEKGLWATRVSFVYSVKRQTVYYALNGDFDTLREYAF